MPAFDKRIGDFDKANTQVLGISTDSPFSHDNWAKSVGISHYPLLSDMQRSVAKDYGIHMAEMNINSRARSEEHTSELQSRLHLVCRLLLEKKKTTNTIQRHQSP